MFYIWSGMPVVLVVGYKHRITEKYVSACCGGLGVGGGGVGGWWGVGAKWSFVASNQQDSLVMRAPLVSSYH